MGEVVCRECRQASPVNAQVLLCAQCGEEFTGKLGRKFCSRKCYSDSTRKWPSDAERDVAKHRARRAKMKGREAEPYTLAEIAVRDGGCCKICHTRVNMKLSGLDEWGPTIDHIVPISRGGDDTKANVRLAHRKCNVKRGARA